MAVIAGTTYINVDGAVLSIKGSIDCSFWDKERATIIGVDGPHGQKETFVAPFVEVTATTTPELDINLLVSLTNSTVQVEFANGKKGLLSGAALMNQPNMNPEEGEVVFRFEGTAGSYS
jgi:hypothetical protein